MLTSSGLWKARTQASVHSHTHTRTYMNGVKRANQPFRMEAIGSFFAPFTPYFRHLVAVRSDTANGARKWRVGIHTVMMFPLNRTVR